MKVCRGRSFNLSYVPCREEVGMKNVSKRELEIGTVEHPTLYRLAVAKSIRKMYWYTPPTSTNVKPREL